MHQDQPSDLSTLKIDRTQPAARFSGRQRKRRRTWLIIGGSAVVLIIIIALSGAFHAAPQVTVTNVTQISPTQSRQILMASGYVVAQRKASIASKGTGRLVALNVVEGQTVRKDEVVARIESSDMEAAIAQARANIELAKAGLKQAEAEQIDAEVSFTRAKALLAAGSISKAEHDMAEARWKRGTAAVQSAQASIRAGEAALNAAEIQLENTRIRAPFDGTVLTKNADIGEVVSPFSASATSRGAVVTMADMSSLEVEVDVSESNIERIAAGQPCEITLDAYPDRRYKGVVSKIVPTADRTKATVLTKVQFQDLDARVLPEMSAKVAFLDPAVDPAQIAAPLRPAVSVDAVVTADGTSHVFVVDKGVIRRRQVQTGATAGTMVEVVSGLAVGEQVVLTPGPDLKDGMEVVVVEGGK